MKILLVGGGYVGSALCPVLARHHEVDVIDLGWFGTEHLEGAARVFVKDAGTLQKQDLAGYGAVLFLAGLSNDPMADHDPLGNFRHNAALPAYLAHIAAEAGVKKFIHGGSCSVYGDTQGFACDETASLERAKYPYGVSKLMGEIGCLAQRDRMAVIALRKGTICGPSPRMRFDLVVNKMTLDAVREGVITVTAPEAWRPILAMEDAIDAYVAAVEGRVSSGWVLNVFSENAQVLDIARRVRRVVGRLAGRPVEIDNRGGKDPRDYQASQRRTLDILGWRPSRTIEDIAEGVAKYVMASNADFNEDRFYNIRTFRAIGVSGTALSMT